MSFHLEPPSLADMGWVLWGATWAESLSEALGVTVSEIAAWETDPASRPADFDTTLDNLCDIRIQEIQLVQGHLNQTGLGKSDHAESAEPDDDD